MKPQTDERAIKDLIAELRKAAEDVDEGFTSAHLASYESQAVSYHVMLKHNEELMTRTADTIGELTNNAS